jgi:hypothetical protein
MLNSYLLIIPEIVIIPEKPQISIQQNIPSRVEIGVRKEADIQGKNDYARS